MKKGLLILLLLVSIAGIGQKTIRTLPQKSTASLSDTIPAQNVTTQALRLDKIYSLFFPGTTLQYTRGDGSLATFPTSNTAFSNGAGYLLPADITGKADKATTLTINGTTFDLSASRTWTIAGGGSTTITDNLTTSTTGTALDAHQGFVLKGLVDGNTTTIGNKQPLEDQRLSTTNLPKFTGINVLPQAGLSTPPTGFNITDSTGAGATFIFPSGIRKSLNWSNVTGNSIWKFQNKSYTLADSSDVAANTTTISTNTTDIAKRAYAPAFEGENGLYLPVIKAAGLESATGLADHASGGVVASVSGTQGSGNLYLPKPIDPTKPWRCAVLVEINDAQPITELHFSNASNLFSTGLRLTAISTAGISGGAGGGTHWNGYGAAGIPAGTKIWFGMASDGVTVTYFSMPDVPTQFQFSTNANTAAWSTSAYANIKNYNDVNGSTAMFGYNQPVNKLCRLTISTKSTVNRIIGVYWAQSLSGPKDGRLNPPAILQNTILQDASAWYIIPGKQGSQPVDLAMLLHPNGNVGTYGLQSNGNTAELSKLYSAGYLMFGITGAYSPTVDFAGATSSNWGAGAGIKYRKAQLEWVRANILGTKNLFLVGQSMGVMDALSFYRQYPGIARGIVGLSGAYDLSDSYTSRGFSTIIGAGYATWYVNIQAGTGIDPAQQVTTTGTNAVSATSITVSALTAAIPSGTTLTLLSGTGQATVVTTASAALNATSISVTALTVQINAGAKYDMTAYWTPINYGYGAPDDSYYASPFVWKNLYAAATAYSINDIIYKAPSGLTVANYKWSDPTLQYDVYKGVPMLLFHGDADVTIPIAQMTGFASAVNGIGGSVTTTTLSGGTHLSTDIYNGTAIVNFLNSLK